MCDARQENRFDALRLAFAAVVAAYHLVALPDLWRAGEPALASLAELSIQGFFVVSGALVFASLERSQGIVDYALKRARRLYPAYAAVILAPAALSLGLTGDAAGVARYLAANLAFANFLAPDLPGLFQDNRLSAVNGALWTIKIEVMFYLVLPLLAWPLARLGAARSLVFLAIVYVLAEVWRLGVAQLDLENAERFARQLPGQLSFFVSGMALHLLKGGEPASRLAWPAGAAALLLPVSFAPGLEPLRAAGLAGFVAFFAYAPGPAVPAARCGDVSYGLYLTHFPIVQGLAAAGVFAASATAGAALAATLTLAASVALWRFVERPALRRTSHYRREERYGSGQGEAALGSRSTPPEEGRRP